MRCLFAAAGLYLLFGFSPFANWLLIPLESHARRPPEANIAGAAGIIVLGGAVNEGPAAINAEPQLNEAAERMTEAVHLAMRHPELPLIFTGGKAEIFETDAQTEAELARRFFSGFGIGPPRLRVEDKSRNTFENAAFTARLVQPKPSQNWVLVTSAFHMPRAQGLFEAQGFRIIPWPVDFKTGGAGDRWRGFSQASKGLRLTDFAAKEWVGLFVSWLRGEIAWPKGG